MLARIYDRNTIHTDETPCGIIHIKSIKNDARTAMSFYRNRSIYDTPLIVLYSWGQSKEIAHPILFLKTFS